MTEEEKKKQGQSNTSQSTGSASNSGSGTSTSTTDKSTTAGSDAGTSATTSSSSAAASPKAGSSPSASTTDTTKPAATSEKTVGTTSVATPKAEGGAEGNTKTDDTPTWEKNAEEMRSRASQYREYSQSPIEDDTKGQTRPWDEFMNSRINSQQETPEQQAQREKRERTTRRITALADGLIALSNVAGAMGGATPIKQVSLSAAHGKTVKEAAEKRRQNARQYEIARQAAIEAQRKQDADNAKRRENQAKARRQAGKDADTLEYRAAQLELQGGKADQSHQLAEDRAKAAKAHQQEQERQGRKRLALSQERNDISRSKGGGRSGGGSGSAQADYDEYARWEEEHPEEVRKIRTDNAQINPYTKQPEKSVTTTTVKLVNAKMRQRYGSPGRKSNTTPPTQQPKKKSVQGFGGNGKTNGKKKIAGFGK